jgi:2,4-diaminopentanoate dehydrogenase
VTPPRSPYRVIQWGTGAIGAEMITAILDHRTDLDLVGAKVYSDAKHGSDVGTLVGRDPVGVLATADTAEVLAMSADCVLYTPRTANLDEVCAILASGKNVATTAFLFHPRRLPAPDCDRLLAACAQGGVSVHGSGLSPGNLSGVLPLALSGMSRTIDKITLQERADWSVYQSTGITFDNMAFGQPCGRVRRLDSGGTGSAVAMANRSSRSRRCGPWAASIPTTGRVPRTAGR